MIKVNIETDTIAMEGHAGLAPKGSDIACAGVSALTLTLIKGLEEVAGIELTESRGDDFLIIQWEHMNEIGQALIDTWHLGITAIAEEYNCIEFV